MNQQRQYIRLIVEDGMALKLARIGHHPSHHIQLFGHDRQAFCGAALPVQIRRSLKYSAALKERLCAGCVEVLDSLIVAEVAQ